MIDDYAKKVLLIVLGIFLFCMLFLKAPEKNGDTTQAVNFNFTLLGNNTNNNGSFNGGGPTPTPSGESFSDKIISMLNGK
jgi:hypothetical protein